MSIEKFSPAEILKNLKRQKNVTKLSDQKLASLARQFGMATKYGNIAFHTTVKNRSAGLTVYLGSEKVMNRTWSSRQQEIINSTPKTLELIAAYLRKAPLVYIERTMGENKIFAPHCTLYVSLQRKEMLRLAYMWGQTFLPLQKAPGPHLQLVYIPEWQEKDRQILVFPEENITFVLGSDYYGESKKGMLRMGMYQVKSSSLGLGLHAGAKILRARQNDGKIHRLGMLIFGLTATGKTTHACHNHNLTDQGEGIGIIQDDVVFWCKDGSALGTERGWYVKTEGLNSKTQPLLYSAAIAKNAILENVMVDYQGEVYFDDDTLTGNGRCIIQRTDIRPSYLYENINLPPIEELDGLIVAFIIRRNTVVPIVSKLSLEQGTAFFMLGESIESSGSDPRRAGESVREVGTNPFIIGDYTEEGNIFYSLLKNYPGKIQCYLLNTGGIGEIVEQRPDGTKEIKQKVTRVEIPEMAAIIRGIARNAIEWEKEPYFGTLVPKGVEGVEMDRFLLKNFYNQEQIENLVHNLHRERVAWLEQFPELDRQIIQSIS